MHLDGLGKNIADSASRGQGRIRILKDDLHFRAQSVHLLQFITRDILSLKENLAGSRLMQLQNRSAHRRLSAAGLADDTERFPGSYLEGHVVHRFQTGYGFTHHRLFQGKIFLQMSYL